MKKVLQNIFDNLPDTPLSTEKFEILLEGKDFKLERIISTGQVTAENSWYDQDQDEWVILLKGRAILQFADGVEINLKPGDYIFIEAHNKHRVSWTDPDEVCVWLALYVGS